jgi:hypothetical protein
MDRDAQAIPHIPRDGRPMIKVLFLAANPSDTPRLALDLECKEIDARIRAAEHRDGLSLIPHLAVSLDDLSGLLLRHRPGIVHFSGHGDASGAIVLERSGGGGPGRDLRPPSALDPGPGAGGPYGPVSPEALAGLFGVFRKDLRVVVLNACYSEALAKEIVKHIDCAVGMSAPIGDAAAIAFAAEFYQAIGYGRSIRDAFDLGAGRLKREGGAGALARLHKRRGVNPKNLVLVAGPPGPVGVGGPGGPPLIAAGVPAPPPGPAAPAPPALDDGPVPINSPFYVEREVDRRVLDHLAEPGSTVTIKGHSKSGKSSLLVRLRAWSREQGRDSCIVDFHGLGAGSLRDPAALFREVAQVLADRLGLDADPDADWSANRTHKANLSRFLERRVLGRRGRPILLLFDGADVVFSHRPTCEDLFSTLRFWHNERASDLDGRGWDRLGLVIAHATDPALWIRDLNQSPFNVGLRVALEDFDAAQVSSLNDRCDRPLRSPGEVDRLGSLVGGHPYLVRLALYDMATRPRTLDELERVAARQDGPFASPMRQLMNLIGSDEPLRRALRSILDRGRCDDEPLYQRLWAVGLIRGEDRDRVEFRSRVYEDFCRAILRDVP